MLYLQLFIDGVVSGCAIGLVSVSFSYFYATTGTFHVAHAGIYTFSAYLAWWLVGLGVPFAAALALAVAFGGVAGYITQRFLYERLSRDAASPLVMMIASIGLLTVLQNVVAILFTPNIVQFDLSWRLSHISLGGISLSYPQALIFVSSLAIVTALVLFARHSALGKRIRAVTSNPDLAEITRLAPKQVFAIVLAISSAIVAVPGVLIGVDQALQPYTSLLVLLTAVIAMIAGGIGSLTGAFCMSILLAVVQSMSVAFMSGRWSVAAVFGIFIVFILFRPEGLFRSRFSRAV
ncbi:branched-chain amino acid ABC transporter permease [Mesorhizobium sp.]|uniref:branched-chain amino acid ABC transporter permease n=1 Tax=Mesorhizobium sp. TaxID=1871066 RepID=UPI000FEA57C3|nr:branched-chain amino acid ABC transporter permease [Mesorhizobium sp.]RWD63466.1 MAG: branched-chain amino acid ABC transporter permease [Mesorhizobium sp.]TIV56835.1 MAG: branched-chain amino acid ABC transporter permease [Mesorhizobium sp.]